VSGRASLLVLAALTTAGHADEQRGEASAALEVYVQPAPGDAVVIVTPSVKANVTATKWLKLDVDWLSDVVTGATPRMYGPPDVITAATSFHEVRNVVGGGVAATVRSVTLSAGYDYGTENDYRSHLVRAGVRADLFEHNTVLAANYSHSFDSICDLAQPGVPVLLRQPLDSSRGCFSGNPGLIAESLGIDTLEVSWVQTLARRWVGTLVGSYQHLSGFQSNPYRRVWLSGGLFQAQESHPMVRDRGALTARVRYAIERVSGSLGLDLRLYRDTWAVQSLTGELSYEQPFVQANKQWRFQLRARGYVQSGAVFYRDAGQADSYGNTGSVGGFFTADQALAPLADLLIGARATFRGERPARHRYLRAFAEVEASVVIDYLKIFALSPDPPNVQRINSWASALVLGLSTIGRF
jgi:hypothetical protein